MRFLSLRHPEHERAWLRALVALALLAAGLALGDFVYGNHAASELVRGFGYLGVLMVSVVSGFNLVVPVPAAAFIPTFLAAGLDLWPTILVMSCGMTLADSIAYLIGHAGRGLLRGKRGRGLIGWLERVRNRSQFAPLAVLALWVTFVPMPNEVVTLPLGLMGYRFAPVLLILLVGNVAFNAMFAHGVAGLYGLL